jgi:hypothetical protein
MPGPFAAAGGQRMAVLVLRECLTSDMKA